MVFLYILDGGHAPRLCPGCSAHEGSGGMQPDPQTGEELHQDRSVSVCFSAVGQICVHILTLWGLTSHMVALGWGIFGLVTVLK